MTGRFLPWTAGPAAWNMAVDEALLTSYLQGTAPVTLRFYGWDPPALSLGYLQAPLSAARQARCRQAGVEWVRRPTGGRAVFHQHEITYALVTGEREGFSGSVLADYQKIGLGLQRGFALLGLTVEMVSGLRCGKGVRSEDCFAAPSWYELTYQGKKLVGSAQLRRGKALLQHGSILLTYDPWFWQEVWREEARLEAAETAAVPEKVIGLKEAFGALPDPPVVIAALRQGLSEVLGINWEEGSLTAEERRLAARLQREKYANADWNNRRGRREVAGGGICPARKEGASG
ncbi:lipoate--protein ligase family protein [Capillibacterium thermochitinicola]|uniref:Lipoate--protein ligase family protein n=1 Tax=Capillibacterium thermochitinicola TaxID=2699427 RepID=A0A8J6HZT1_9FIRM|nr:biotin/lipoate A/B protein ligase family protein [Capillibacterium thermochitinicola]MBA2133090.1 lipoate--protein ligase family protein [Capillibacterium thermochitinicola]